MKKYILSVSFLLSLLPMNLSWFGGLRGVQEIKGLIVLFNPITIISILAYFIGIWYPFKNNRINKILSMSALILIVFVELYCFVFWHYETISGKIDLNTSIQMTYPEFYLGLAVSIIMVGIHCFFMKKQKVD